MRWLKAEPSLKNAARELHLLSKNSLRIHIFFLYAALPLNVPPAEGAEAVNPTKHVGGALASSASVFD